MFINHGRNPGPKPISLLDRVVAHMGSTNERGCVIWLGAPQPNGYGRITLSGSKKYIGAHCAVWQIVNGPIPNGMCVLHSCDNRICVNIDHLFLGTQQDNINDMVAKGRQTKGEASHLSIMTDEIILDIRALCRSGLYSQRKIARMFGISQAVVSQIKRGITWKHLPI